jgi:hypothetical protein
MIPIEITDKMKATARRGEASIMKHYAGKKDPTGLDEPDKYYIGIVGELAFVKLLRDEGIRADYAPKWDGKADRGDVDVYYDGGYRLTVDVKTCSKEFHKNVWFPASHYKQYSYDGYIGVRLVGDVAEIHGYCAKKDFVPSTHPGSKVPNYEVPLDKLRPCERLWTKLDKGTTNINLP